MNPKYLCAKCFIEHKGYPTPDHPEAITGVVGIVIIGLVVVLAICIGLSLL